MTKKTEFRILRIAVAQPLNQIDDRPREMVALGRGYALPVEARKKHNITQIRPPFG